MRVSMYYNNSDLRLEKAKKPSISDDEILIKIISSGICGSDVMEWYRIKKAPLVLGHEISGDIVKIGKNVKDFKLGDRVVATHHVPCNNCEYCQRGQHSLCHSIHNTKYYPGGFSEFVRLPAVNLEKGGVIKLPDSVSYDDGSFVEPLGCVVRGLRELDFKPTRSILVLGSGLSGQLIIRNAKAYGAGQIIATDLSQYRIDFAKKSGADLVIDATKEDVIKTVLEATEGKGVDYVVITAGAKILFEQAMKTVKDGGKVLLYGIMAPGTIIDFDIFPFWQKQVQLVSTYAAAPIDLREALELIRAKRVNVTELITHRLGLEETGKGFELTASAADSMKVIIQPQK